jgi:hypothetical protein
MYADVRMSEAREPQEGEGVPGTLQHGPCGAAS